MNRRQFFAAVVAAASVVVVPLTLESPQPLEPVAAIQLPPVWLRGTYYGWPRPGCPPW